MGSGFTMRVVAARDGAVKPFAIWITGAHVHVVTLGLLYVKSRRWLPWGKRPPRCWYCSYCSGS